MRRIGEIVASMHFGGYEHWRRPDELPAETVADLRAMWWRLRRQGVRLPAQKGIIDMGIGGR